MGKGRKSTIFFARTYRRLNPDRKAQILYILLLVLPCVIAFLFLYPQLTELVARWSSVILADALGCPEPLPTATHEYIPWFGPISYVVIEGPRPGVELIVGSALACLAVSVFFATGRRKGMPGSIFLLFGLTVQLVSCVFFVVGAEEFPYDGDEYSALYMIQQVGIWLFFLIISGLVTGMIGYGNVFYKILTYVVIMAYSLIFGFARYIVYLYIVARFSTLFVAALFFSLGPFFDFLYLVFFYGLFVDHLNKSLNRRDRTEVWLWT